MIKHLRTVALAWLSSAGILPEQIRQLLEQESDPVLVMKYFQENGRLYPEISLSNTVLQTLRNKIQIKILEKWDDLADQYGIQAITIKDNLYPSKLYNIDDAPGILFYQGSLEALSLPAVAIVGSRRASIKGISATKKISSELSRNQISVISGLAYGIDAAAHQGCILGGTPTIAVMGCGLDQDYPVENAGLKKDILRQKGLILSEYAPGEKPLGWHFPYRNRIISGLGDCLALMEAKIRSGSMTTVQHALNQGKDVFVYPGEPENTRFEGNHQLLREGAIYFTTACDLMEDMGWLDKQHVVGQNIDHDIKTCFQGSAEERRILDQLDKGEQSFDQLCVNLDIPASRLSASLSLLQIQGHIRALPGKLYQRNQD